MPYITTKYGFSSRTNSPFEPDRRHRADFARQAVIAAFGWHHACALDQADFIDHPPRSRKALGMTSEIGN